MRAWKSVGVGKSPMQAGGDAGKDGAAFGVGLIANGDHVGEDPAGFEEIEHGLGFVGGEVYADLLHGLHDDAVEFAGLQSGAVGFELLPADLIQERLSHLAAGAVVNADKQDFFLAHGSLSTLPSPTPPLRRRGGPR